MRQIRGVNLAVLVSLILLLSLGYAAAFTGGDGSLANPYQINNCTALNETRLNLYANYTLTNDIDCTDTKNWGGPRFVPIGMSPTSFQGVFEGNNYKIINLSINGSGTYETGLFSLVASAKIKNVVLENINLEGNINSVGGLVGFIVSPTSDSTYIQNCHVIGGIINNSLYLNTGGLVGASTSNPSYYNYIQNSSSNATIIGNARVGGLIGNGMSAGSKGVIIENSYSSGNIFGTQYVGGLAGYMDGSVPVISTIKNSYSTAFVNSTGTHAGGLVGFAYLNITDSYASVNVYGTQYVGQLVGSNWQGGGPIANSFAIGKAFGTVSNFGGIAGINDHNGAITNCYWYNSTDDSANVCSTTTGGGTVTNCVVEDDITYFKSSSNSPMAGWDFANKWAISPIVNNGFPYLRWQDFGTQYASFSGSTNFAALTNKNNVTNAKLANSQGSIQWQNGINVNGADFDSNAKIGYGFVSINTSMFDPSINTTANVTIQTQSCNGLVIKHATTYYTTLGDIMSNGADCLTDGSCSNIQCVQGQVGATATFTANQFDGFGGSGGAVPEFSDLTAILALIMVVGGFFAMRRRV